ncbi:NADH-quinone oxidoreductase subunit M [Candidatus Ecksteinia adelgidicola]|nr:NADH-quinone oxidoreductase subunit M [Candidatus Ecksteinia adelgidicola]
MLLPLLILIPFIGGLLCWQFENFNINAPRWIALITTILIIGITLKLWLKDIYVLASLKYFPKWTNEFLLPWIPRFGISIHLALDNLSLIMIALTSLLGLYSVLCSWCEIKKYQGFFYLNLLWIICSVISVFLAIDLFLFFFFWEFMLVPMYFLISLWGHKGLNKKDCITAATKFFIYMQISGLIMFISIFGLVLVHYNSSGIWTFDYEQLLHTSMSYHLQYLLMLGFFIAFSVKIPVVPFHGWLPDAHVHAPTSGSVDLAGILVKTAAYGLMRFTLPLFPEASHSFSKIAFFLGIINIFYGAWIAFVQSDIKRFIAYSSISHMGFVLIAIYTNNIIAYQGAVVQMIAHGLSASGMFIICGQLYERLHTRDMSKMGGLWGQIQYIPALSLFFSAATLGIPGTGNFIGEFLILCGNFKNMPIIAIISTFGLIFASIYSLTMIQKTYYGNGKLYKTLLPISIRELAITLSLAILLVILGVYPQPVLNKLSFSIHNLQYWLH